MIFRFLHLERTPFWQVFLFVFMVHLLSFLLFYTARYIVHPFSEQRPPTPEAVSITVAYTAPLMDDYPPLDASLSMTHEDAFVPDSSVDAFADLLQEWQAPRVSAPVAPPKPPSAKPSSSTTFENILQKNALPPSTDDSYENATALTVAESAALNGQFRMCWLVQGGSPYPENLKVILKLVMNADATVRQIVVMDEARMDKDPFFRVAVERAVQSFSRPECQQLQLPLADYHRWRVVYMEFNPFYLLQ